ncbi:MAG: hypothetical protein WCI73_12855 [Phycisphaerae bacterium]
MTTASKSPALPAKWVTCVTYPLSGSNNPDAMCQSWYYSIAIWVDEDPKIARWAMEDVVNYIQYAKWGLPQSHGLVSNVLVDWQARKVQADWRDQEEVKIFCSSHGYVPSPASPASAPR